MSGFRRNRKSWPEAPSEFVPEVPKRSRSKRERKSEPGVDTEKKLGNRTSFLESHPVLFHNLRSRTRTRNVSKIKSSVVVESGESRAWRLNNNKKIARECRERKKLRHEYLESLIHKIESKNLALRQELKQLRAWAVQIDKGIKPQDFIDYRSIWDKMEHLDVNKRGRVPQNSSLDAELDYSEKVKDETRQAKFKVKGEAHQTSVKDETPQTSVKDKTHQTLSKRIQVRNSDVFDSRAGFPAYADVSTSRNNFVYRHIPVPPISTSAGIPASQLIPTYADAPPFDKKLTSITVDDIVSHDSVEREEFPSSRGTVTNVTIPSFQSTFKPFNLKFVIAAQGVQFHLHAIKWKRQGLDTLHSYHEFLSRQ